LWPLEPDRLFETRTLSEPVMINRVTIEPAAEGARLEQQVTASLENKDLPVAEEGWFARLFGSATRTADEETVNEESLAEIAAQLQEKLQ
jgi:hypothetical protein